MEVIITHVPGMKSPSGSYKAENRPRMVFHPEGLDDILKRLNQAAPESPWKTFLNDLRNGNNEGQLQYLSYQYERMKRHRTLTGGHVPSRNQLLLT